MEKKQDKFHLGTHIHSAIRSALCFLSFPDNIIVIYVIPIIFYIGITFSFLLPKVIAYGYIPLILYFAFRRKALPIQYLSSLAAYLVIAAISGIPLLKESLVESVIGLEKLLGCNVIISPDIFFSGSIIVLSCSGLLGYPRIAFIAVASIILLFLITLLSVQIYCRYAFISPSDFTIILLAIRGVLELWNLSLFIMLCRTRINVRQAVSIVTAVFLLVIVLPAMGVFDRIMLQQQHENYNESVKKTVGFWWPEASRVEELGFHNTQGHYGVDAIGFWGELPILLQRSGFRVLKATNISTDILSQCRVFCLLSPPRGLTSAEILALNEFVANGGSLFVAAEHTNLDKNMEIFNPLLGNYGISINFDTTNGLFGDGLKGVILGKHPLGRYVSETPYLVHNRGASLSISGHQAFPVLTGKFWYGDAGNVLAPDKAYLSNYQISYGDRIGELVLMAIWEGKNGGKVFVTGDTSAFLNQNIGYDSFFITALFNYLASDAMFHPYSIKMILITISFTLACIILFILLRSYRISVTMALIGLVLLGGNLGIFKPSMASPPISRPLAAVSSSENNMVSCDPFSPFSPTGLLVTTTRFGFVPYFGDWKIHGITPDALFIINPSKKISKAQLEGIAKKGTIVIVSGGGDNEAFVKTARQFNVSVVDPPLGNMEDDSLSTYSAWQVDGSGDTGSIKVKGVAIGVKLPYESGSVVFIADKGFFYSKNLETSTTYDAKDQLFIQKLITQK